MNDCDWCAADTQINALLALTKHFGYETMADYLRDYGDAALTDIRELTDEEMNRLQFREDDETQTKIPFAEKLQEMIQNSEKFPSFFASTEY
jgi:hypothetical protein